MNWKKYIDSFECEVHYAEPATKEQINEVERQLGVKLPPKLLALLNQSNGVFDEHRCHYVWPTNRIIEDNLYFRQFEDFKDVLCRLITCSFSPIQAVVIYLRLRF